MFSDAVQVLLLMVAMFPLAIRHHQPVHTVDGLHHVMYYGACEEVMTSSCYWSQSIQWTGLWQFMLKALWQLITMNDKSCHVCRNCLFIVSVHYTNTHSNLHRCSVHFQITMHTVHSYAYSTCETITDYSNLQSNLVFSGCFCFKALWWLFNCL